MKKILAILLSMVLVLGMFAGCGKNEAGGAAGGAAAGNNNSGSNAGTGETGTQVSVGEDTYGMLVLNVNGAMNIYYDSEGLVVNVEGINENGNILAAEYEDYLGKATADVVSDLIANSSLSGFMTQDVNYIMIKQAHGSKIPGDDFMTTITAAAEAALTAIEAQVKVVVLTLEDLDEQGYIGLEAAKELMLAYLYSDSFDLLEGSTAPIDERYGFYVTVGELEEKLIIHAVTGDVYPGELDGVYYGDEMLEEDIPVEPTDDIEGDADFTEPTISNPEEGDVVSTDPTEPEATEAAGA